MTDHPAASTEATHAATPRGPYTDESGPRGRPPISPSGLPELGEWAFTAVVPLAAIYAKTLIEALATRSADGITAWPGKVRQRWFRHGGIHRVAVVLEPENGHSAAILVTADLTDEARLALLDLDLTHESMRGKILTWDENDRRWVPTEPPGWPIPGPDRP
ncbi:hypothetical protein ACLMAL_10135 [Nocardia sp. CWNU-33]|uniref:hypothetical protein n=1 Tax=Nocardia sp. CWNU-33 TaxID=3392117 RepID=UPI00398E79D1